MSRTFVLGIGSGRCGTFSLAGVLSQQPETSVSHEERPLLPWAKPEGVPGIRERMERIRNTRKERVVGDVASFYLPYVEEAIQLDSDIRVVCLKRPRHEVVASFCKWVDAVHPLPTNHWTQDPPPGWYHDADWTRIFPQYETEDREEGIGRYWDEYYEKVDDLMRRYPEHIRQFDTDEALNTEEGVRSLLTFIGIPEERQILVVGTRKNKSAPPRQPGWRAARVSSDPKDPRKCVVLVPYTGHIDQHCDDALKELERRGYPVRRVPGYAAIDQGRNQLATDALLNGFEETMWIDSDIGFHPDSVDRLRSHRLPMVCGIYAQKGKRAIACHIMPGTPNLVFGRDGGLQEILYAGAGFLHVRREVYLTVQQRLALPMCNERFRRPMIPFFLPTTQPFDDGYWYLAEDYSFCQRVYDCGYTIMADTTIRLWHFGTYGYGWEDSGVGRDRHAAFTLHFPDKPDDRERR